MRGWLAPAYYFFSKRFFFFFIFISIILPQQGFVQETCCHRRVNTIKITGADPSTERLIRRYWTDLTSIGTHLDDCPLILEATGNINPASIEYYFAGHLSVTTAAGLGDEYTLTMELVDSDNNTVVRKGSASWIGFPTDGLDSISNLAQQFKPLDDIIHDYEGMPESCEIEPEKDPVESGEEMTVEIKKILDHKQRSPQTWQRLFVKAEKGKILNGKAKGDYKVFEVGSGSITLQYKAPDECKKDKETISVENSCNKEKHDAGTPEREIRRAQFEIVCSQWEGIIASSGTISSQGDESLITALMPESKYQTATNWKLDVVLKIDRGNERVKIYELESARFDFLDEFEFENVMHSEAGKSQMTGQTEAEAKGRQLAPSECKLELIIDLKKKTYKIEGILDVKNITEKGDSEFKLDWPPIHGEEKDSGDQMTEYREEILIEGKFSEEDLPEKLEGSIDEMKEVPPEFADFMEALAGKISGKIRWKLERKGRQ